MQGLYHSNRESVSAIPREIVSNNREDILRIGVTIFFCTLGEVLLDNFLTQIMRKMKIPHLLQEHLLVENRYVKERCNKLFPSLVGDKWKSAIKQISKGKDLDYEETNTFFKCLYNKRNDFLHKGATFIFPDGLSGRCINEIWPLLCIFVELHNKYIAEPGNIVPASGPTE
jgi:hypothetical protein